MSNTSEFTHGVGSNLDYGFNWSAWLAVGETITQSTWTVTTGIVLTNQLISGSTTSTFASGGEASKIYQLYNTITTSADRIDSRTLTLSCKKR